MIRNIVSTVMFTVMLYSTLSVDCK